MIRYNKWSGGPCLLANLVPTRSNTLADSAMDLVLLRGSSPGKFPSIVQVLRRQGK